MSPARAGSRSTRPRACFAGEGHIPLAATPHYRSATPIEGLAEPAEVDFKFEMSVSRIAEAVRITKPFTEARWQALLALGDRVDAELDAADARLTMGGEPTFIADGDFDAPEWNSAAVGPTKAAYADKLIRIAAREIRPRLAVAPRPGQVVPGRKPAALGLFDLLAQGRRADLARPHADRRRAAARGEAGGRPRSTRRWQEASWSETAQYLGVEPEFVQPVYEDAVSWIVKEAELPENTCTDRSQARGSRGTRALHAHVRARTDQAGRLRPAGAALERRGRAGAAVEERAVESAARRVVRGAGRLGARLPPAAGLAALRAALGLSPTSTRATPPKRASRWPISARS